MKSQLSYNTALWSPNQISLKTQVKRVEEGHMLDPQKTRQRDVIQGQNFGSITSSSILWPRTQRPRSCLNGLPISKFINLSPLFPTAEPDQVLLKILKHLFEKTGSFQAFYFNLIVKLWNCIEDYHFLSIFQLKCHSRIFFVSTGLVFIRIAWM